MPFESWISAIIPLSDLIRATYMADIAHDKLFWEILRMIALGLLSLLGMGLIGGVLAGEEDMKRFSSGKRMEPAYQTAGMFSPNGNAKMGDVAHIPGTGPAGKYFVAKETPAWLKRGGETKDPEQLDWVKNDKR